ncbi:MAG: hypothetical protein F7C35_04900 [Desulfurococcales archaeon]|nr:hypothetical protein [Desulfurococcales archaeon]
MKLQVTVQGFDENLQPMNSCDEIDLGMLTADEVIGLLKGLTRPEGYEDWDCGINFNIIKGPQRWLTVTFNEKNNFTLVEQTPEDMLVDDGLTFEEVAEAIRKYYLL